jgi:hypothetical protein
MSIATDEAEEWAQSQYVGSSHIERHDGHAVSVPNYPQKVSLRADGYVAGRTARTSTVEVEEAAYALWKTEVNMADLNPTESEYTDAWGKLSKQQRDMYRSKASTVLDAARKAVTE